MTFTYTILTLCIRPPFCSFLTLRTGSPEGSHTTEMYIMTVKKFLATND